MPVSQVPPPPVFQLSPFHVSLPGLARLRNRAEPPQALATDVVGFEESAQRVLATGYADEQLVLHDERRARDVEPFHRVGDLHLPERQARPRIETDERGIVGPHEQPMAKDGDAAVDAVRLVRVADLLLPRPSPDLTAAARIDGRDRAGIAPSGRIHHAVHDERRALEDRVPGDWHRPFGSQPAHIRRVDRVEGGVMGPLIISPVHQPVVGLGLRVAEAFVRDAPGDGRRHGGLARIAPLPGPQVGNNAGDVGRRKACGVVGRVQRRVLRHDRGQRQLVEQMQLSGSVHHLQRERILVAANAANLAAVPRRCHDGCERCADAAAACGRATLGGRRTVRIGDLLPKRRDGETAGGRQVRADNPAAPVYFVAGRARRPSEEQRLASRRILLHGHRGPGLLRSGHTLTGKHETGAQHCRRDDQHADSATHF